MVRKQGLLLPVFVCLAMNGVANAYLHPGVGRFMQRDPLGYVDGMGLYEYVGSRPPVRVDPYGHWNADVHTDLTMALASMAGIACAKEIAGQCNQPDVDDRRPGGTGVLDIPKAGVTAFLLNKDRVKNAKQAMADKIAKIAEWHFPADSTTGGVVVPNSAAANAKVDAAIRKCNWKDFAEGLHVLQDSWSHQGNPATNLTRTGTYGMGHFRGAFRDATGKWRAADGTNFAATDSAADDVTIYPEDAYATGEATYVRLLEFKQACPCHCPGPGATLRVTSSGHEVDMGIVMLWIYAKYPGQNLPAYPVQNPGQKAAAGNVVRQLAQ